MAVKNLYPNNKTARQLFRAMVFSAILMGPFAGFAIAAASENGRDMSGAGFVLYMAMIR
ncbi:MAG: hypothetical protein U5K75_11580 [Ahrensia sp.]|nr:hypothetical protein [Ahrensia sp.]